MRNGGFGVIVFSNWFCQILIREVHPMPILPNDGGSSFFSGFLPVLYSVLFGLLLPFIIGTVLNKKFGKRPFAAVILICCAAGFALYYFVLYTRIQLGWGSLIWPAMAYYFLSRQKK